EIHWPDTEIWAVPLEGDRDLVLVLGPEPHLRWPTWCRTLLEVLEELDVSLVVLLGALLAELPHTLPSRISGSAHDPELRRRLDLKANEYEGPTGIVGVLASSLMQGEIATVSLWAAVPTYIGAPDPKAQLAL